MRRKVFRMISDGGIGDAILTTPSFQAIKQKFPDCKLAVYCTRQAHINVYQNNPHIDILKFARFWADPIQFIKYHLNRGRFHVNSYGAFNPSFHSIGKAAEIIGEMFHVRLTARSPQIYLTESEDKNAMTFLKDHPNPVIVHISPIWSPNKAWLLERWAELVKRVPEVTFIQIGVAKDERIAGVIDMCDKSSLRQSFALIKHARCFVGVESGMSHAAAAFGTPGVTLFGPSNPETWGHPTNINLSLGLRCSPCTDLLKREVCPYGRPCMTGITVADVAKALRKQLSLYADNRLSRGTPGFAESFRL